MPHEPLCVFGLFAEGATAPLGTRHPTSETHTHTHTHTHTRNLLERKERDNEREREREKKAMVCSLFSSCGCSGQSGCGSRGKETRKCDRENTVAP